MSCQRLTDSKPEQFVQHKPDQRLHWQRRGLQWLTLLLILFIPISGLFRIDPVAGAFVVLDRQIWFSDFFIVVGLWLMVSCALVMTYSFVGTAFCGWSCPQNSLAEWANLMTHKWLGKRADVALDAAPMRVSSGKNKWRNWVVLGAMFTLASMAVALVPLFYFYPPDVIWSFVSFREDDRLAGSLYWIYSVFVLIIFLDIAFIRHFWCRFMCIYRVWQHSFKTRETLRIVHDASRPDECGNCNYCVTACFVEIDPRQTETYDSCINCGECINACNRVRAARKTGSSLLRFQSGQGKPDTHSDSNVGSVVRRAPWAALLSAFGLAMFVWGLMDYQPYHFSVYRAETLQGDSINDYRINIANKLYRPVELNIAVEGLAVEDYQLAQQIVSFSHAGRQDVGLKISAELAQGLHPFIVRLTADNGWHDSFRVHHYATGGRHE